MRNNDDDSIRARLIARIAELKQELKTVQMNGDDNGELDIYLIIGELEQILNVE